MGAFLLLIIAYFVVKNLRPKEETVVRAGKKIEELKILDRALPQKSPFAPANMGNMGVVEDEQAKAAALISTLESFPAAKAVVINPAVSPAAVIRADMQPTFEEFLAAWKRKAAGGPVLTNPEALYRALHLQPFQRILA